MVDAVFNHCGRKFAPWLDVLEHGKGFLLCGLVYGGRLGADWKKEQTPETGVFDSLHLQIQCQRLNTNKEEVIEYFCKVCEEWIRKFDIDGIRFDVGNEVSHRFLKRMREHLKTDKTRHLSVGRNLARCKSVAARR